MAKKKKAKVKKVKRMKKRKAVFMIVTDGDVVRVSSLTKKALKRYRETGSSDANGGTWDDWVTL